MVPSSQCLDGYRHQKESRHEKKTETMGKSGQQVTEDSQSINEIIIFQEDNEIEAIDEKLREYTQLKAWFR